MYRKAIYIVKLLVRFAIFNTEQYLKTNVGLCPAVNCNMMIMTFMSKREKV